MFLKYCAISIMLLCTTTIGAKVIPFNSQEWNITGDGSMDLLSKKSQVTTYKGEKALYLAAGGKAVLNNSKFLNGTIEYDVMFPQKRGFIGVMWRMQDNKNFEEFYMRPHQSGNPDANQYTPVYNSISGWQLYYGKQFSVAYKYPFNEWFHVKIVVSGESAEIYIKNMKKPSLIVNLKREIRSGKVGLKVAGSPMFKLTGAYFANFDYTPLDNVKIKEIPIKVVTPSHTILNWKVSNAFSQNVLDGYKIDSSMTDELKWIDTKTDNRGILNFASVSKISKEKNTIFAKIKFYSKKEQVKRIDFGFSDTVKVYFNNKLLFSANDTYRTRDYRFLGTVGYYDSLYIPMKKGENEIWFAVSEKFGGWGIKAKFEDFDNIKLLNK